MALSLDQRREKQPLSGRATLTAVQSNPGLSNFLQTLVAWPCSLCAATDMDLDPRVTQDPRQ